MTKLITNNDLVRYVQHCLDRKKHLMPVGIEVRVFTQCPGVEAVSLFCRPANTWYGRLVRALAYDVLKYTEKW